MWSYRSQLADGRHSRPRADLWERGDFLESLGSLRHGTPVRTVTGLDRKPKARVTPEGGELWSTRGTA